MKRKAIIRGLIGLPIGITISYLISIIANLIISNTSYLGATPQLVNAVNSELTAVIIQFIASGILGFGTGASSVIWEIENWSLLKHTIMSFVAISIFVLIPAYFLYWMPHTTIGILIYILLFVLIFMIIWIIKYLYIKNKIKKMKASLQKRNNK